LYPPCASDVNGKITEEDEKEDTKKPATKEGYGLNVKRQQLFCESLRIISFSRFRKALLEIWSCPGIPLPYKEGQGSRVGLRIALAWSGIIILRSFRRATSSGYSK